MKTILVIEDNLEIRENTCELLELEGFIVFSAENGRKGIEMVKEKQPDLILCDIMMPEATGYEVLQELKKRQNSKNIPFVFLTSNVDKKSINYGLEMGAKAYIHKPFLAQELFDTINCFL